MEEPHAHPEAHRHAHHPDAHPSSHAPPTLGAKAKFVFLATQFGQEMVNDIQAVGQYIDLQHSDPGKKPHISYGLLHVAGKAVLEYWLDAAKESERLNPMHDKIYIVTNGDNYMEYRTWVARNGQYYGITVDDVHSTGVGIDAPRPGTLVDLAWLIEKEGLYADTLVVVEAHSIFEPDFNLVRVIEYAQVRGKDCVCYHTPWAGADLSREVVLELDDYSTANPRITGMRLDAAGVKNDGKRAVLAPLYVFRRGNIPAMLAFAKTQPGPYKQIQAYLAAQMAAGKLAYAIKHDIYFTAKRLSDFLLTDNFFKHYGKVRAEEAARVQPAQKVTNLTFKAAEHPYTTGYVPQPRGIFSIFNEWIPIYIGSLNVKVQIEQGMTLPARFVDPSVWQYQNKPSDHPFYGKTSRLIGGKLPAVVDMPAVYNPSNYQFTTSFTVPIRHHNITTYATRDRVIDRPDNWL